MTRANPENADAKLSWHSSIYGNSLNSTLVVLRGLTWYVQIIPKGVSKSLEIVTDETVFLVGHGLTGSWIRRTLVSCFNPPYGQN
jgi:hypothetical protein